MKDVILQGDEGDTGRRGQRMQIDEEGGCGRAKMVDVSGSKK